MARGSQQRNYHWPQMQSIKYTRVGSTSFICMGRCQLSRQPHSFIFYDSTGCIILEIMFI